MAYYLVTAKPRLDRLPQLLQNLRRRTYVTMSPFGRSLTDSLHRSRLRDDGYAVWEEEDYCSPPLAQERAAALDEFFDEIDVAPVERGRSWSQIDELPRLFPELEIDFRSGDAR